MADFVQHRGRVDVLIQPGAHLDIKGSSGHTAVPLAIRHTGTECDFTYNKATGVDNSGCDMEAINDWFCDSKFKSTEFRPGRGTKVISTP